VNAPVTINGTTQGPGPDYSAQLFLVNPDNSLRPLIPVSNFNAEGLGAASIKNQFWIPKTVTIPGHFAGETLNFKVRAWRTAAGSFDADFNGRGESAVFTAVLGGPSQDPNTPPATPANLLNLKSFMVGPSFPEPSTLTLGLLGAAVLVVFRRSR